APDRALHHRRGIRLLNSGEALIELQIALRHGLRREALLEHLATHAPVDTVESLHGFYGSLDAFHHVAGTPLFHDLGHRAMAERNHRGTASHRFYHHQPEGLRPIDREEQRTRATQ